MSLKSILGSVRIIGNGTIRYTACEFLFILYMAIVLYRIRHRARYWSKIAIFSYPLLHSNPCRKRLRLFSHCFFTTDPYAYCLAYQAVQKDSAKTSVYSQLKRVTDTQTDRRQCDLISNVTFAKTLR